jgi:hypothetical protein
VAGVDVSGPDGGQNAAARRELERRAYGRGATEEERRLALEELARIPAPVADAQPAGARSAGAHRVSPFEDRVPEDAAPPSDGDRPHLPPETARGRLARRWALAGGALAGALLTAFLIPSALEPSSLEVFERAQTDRDRNAPLDVANAVAAGATASAEPGDGAALFASLRRLEGRGVSAFAFTDGSVVCLAAARRIECAPGGDFRRDGIRLEVDEPGAGGTRYSWGPKGILRSEHDDAILDPTGDSRALLVRLCMADHGQDASATSTGEVVAGPGVDSRTLDFAMARLDCAVRYPIDED